METLVQSKLPKFINSIGEKPLNKISKIKEVIIFITNEKSVKESANMLSEYTKLKDSLPTKLEGANFIKLKKTVSLVNTQLKLLTSFMDFIDSFLQKTPNHPTEIKIDDKHMQAALCNTKETINVLNYISDYINLALQVKKAKEEMMVNSKVYTLEELLTELNAA